MDNKIALEMVNKIFNSVFEMDNSDSLEKLFDKYAFDIKLPNKVYDTTTNEVTWTANINATSYITNDNMEKWDANKGWMIPKRDVESLEEIINIWKGINYTTTERVYNSDDVIKSDPIYNCHKVYQSTNCGESKNIIWCDGCYNSDYAMASQRSNNLNFCIRADDSNSCSNSYNVICSCKISNSLFIQDCSDLYECIFCSHISNQRFCIANMQFDEEEYYLIKKEIIKWILES